MLRIKILTNTIKGTKFQMGPKSIFITFGRRVDEAVEIGEY